MSNALLAAYLDGPRQLREAVGGLSDEQAHERPIAGKMSTLEVVCHLGDFELVGADRLRRVLVLDRPQLLGFDENDFLKTMAYDRRALGDELELIERIRRQTALILAAAPPEAWSRVGVHSEAGELTLESLLKRIVDPVTHHIPFIVAKRRRLLGEPSA